MLMKAKRGLGVFQTRLLWDIVPPWLYRELNSGPLQEQVLLTAEQSPQPYWSYFEMKLTLTVMY